MVGHKKMNDLIRRFDLGMEGVYCKEKATLTFKKGHSFTDAKKKKIIDGITKVYNEGDREVRDFKFKMEV